jgi:endoglucanase
MRFGNLLVTASTVVLAVAAPAVEKKKRTSKFQWFGVNESGAEFGSGSIPGQLGKDYTWPVDSSIDTLVSKGANIFRTPLSPPPSPSPHPSPH